MMSPLIVIIFITGYAAIAFEHKLQLNKAASALITGVLCWLIYFVHVPSQSDATELLMHSLGEIASILFFLLGAMTIVEVIDSHDGFDLVTHLITSKHKSSLLLLITVLTFFL